MLIIDVCFWITFYITNLCITTWELFILWESKDVKNTVSHIFEKPTIFFSNINRRQHRHVTIPISESFINFTRAHPNGSITSHYVNYIINIFTRFSLKKFYVDVDFMRPVLYVWKEFRQTIQNGKEMYIYASPLWNWAIESQIVWWYFFHYKID